MAQMSHFEIMKTCYENERKRVLATAYERVTNLEESARLLRIAYEKGDIQRIAWLTRTLDVELSTRANVLHENLHMIAGLEAQRDRETAASTTAAIADDRCYCESLAHQGRADKCEVCKRRKATPLTNPEPRCDVPMCGESGLCEACQKRGAR